MKIIKKQLIVLIIFSALVSIASIIHGIYFDLELDEIKRLTIGGIIFTFIVFFPAIIILEKIFDINNNIEIKKINQRLDKLEKRKK